MVTGLDGRKMSKSYDNYIGLFESDSEIKKKVKRIVTDSKGVAEIKNPDECNVFKLYKLFATPDEVQTMANAYRNGGIGYGTAKEEFYQVLLRELGPIRDKYQYFKSRPTEVYGVLEDGASRARKIAKSTIEEVREAIGIG